MNVSPEGGGLLIPKINFDQEFSKFSMILILSTPTCQPCKTAVKILDSRGIPNQKIDLTEDAEKLAWAKAKMKSETISTPTFEFDGNLYQGMNRLQEVIALAQAA